MDVTFGDYANPSFESQVETIGKAKTQGIMSTEAAVDELYGDSRDEEWKKTEVSRIKSEQGILSADEPAANSDMDWSTDNEEFGDDAGSEEDVPDDGEGSGRAS